MKIRYVLIFRYFWIWPCMQLCIPETNSSQLVFQPSIFRCELSGEPSNGWPNFPQNPGVGWGARWQAWYGGRWLQPRVGEAQPWINWSTRQWGWYCWWQPELRQENQLRLVVYPIICREFCISGGAGILPSAQYIHMYADCNFWIREVRDVKRQRACSFGGSVLGFQEQGWIFEFRLEPLDNLEEEDASLRLKTWHYPTRWAGCLVCDFVHDLRIQIDSLGSLKLQKPSSSKISISRQLHYVVLIWKLGKDWINMNKCTTKMKKLLYLANLLEPFWTAEFLWVGKKSTTGLAGHWPVQSSAWTSKSGTQKTYDSGRWVD